MSRTWIIIVRIVKEKSTLRGLIHAMHAVQQQALEAQDDPDEIVGRARMAIEELSREQAKTGLVALEEIVQTSYDRISKIFEAQVNVTGLATGYSTLDMMTAGLQPSEFIVLAARPSQGKSSLALNIAENVAARRNLPVAIFSLEMSKESLLLRLISSISGIDSHKFRTGMLSREDRARLTTAFVTLAQVPIWIDDSSSSSMNEIAAKAQRLKNEKGLALVIVDYIQLIAGARRSGSNRQSEVSEISRALKALAKDLKVPVLALSQLTRAPEHESRRPQLSDLRESGAIEQDADVVMFIYRPAFYKHDEPPEERCKAELIVAKQRNGPVANVKFIFRDGITRFEEAAPDDWDSGLGQK